MTVAYARPHISPNSPDWKSEFDLGAWSFVFDNAICPGTENPLNCAKDVWVLRSPNFSSVLYHKLTIGKHCDFERIKQRWCYAQRVNLVHFQDIVFI